MTPPTTKTFQIEDTEINITEAIWEVGTAVSQALSLYTQRAAEKMHIWRSNVMPIDDYTFMKELQETQETVSIITPEYPASNDAFVEYFGVIVEAVILGSQVFNQARNVEVRFRVVV
jgi:hypothetical protein